MGTGSFPGVKRLGRGVDHPPPSRAEVKERVELYRYSTSGPSWPVIVWTFLPLLIRRNCEHLARFEGLTQVPTKITNFWDVTPCTLADIYRCAGETYSRHRHSYPKDESYTFLWNIYEVLANYTASLPRHRQSSYCLRETFESRKERWLFTFEDKKKVII